MGAWIDIEDVSVDLPIVLWMEYVRRGFAVAGQRSVVPLVPSVNLPGQARHRVAGAGPSVEFRLWRGVCGNIG